MDVDVLYSLLHKIVHDLDDAPGWAVKQTETVFNEQWRNHPEGNALLSDSWFRSNVVRILTEEETLLDADWFKGKCVLDVGCGNGRWAYGFAQLGADLVCTDTSPVAVEATRKVLEPFTAINKEFHVCPVESLTFNRRFDLVWCWGVLHHCRGFNRGLNKLMGLVNDSGVLYLYLYGDGSLSYERDLALFKERLHYYSLRSEKDKYEFLLRKCKGDKGKIHGVHDAHAPLINRRLNYEYVKGFLERGGFKVTRTIDHTELFIRADKGANPMRSKMKAPY